MVRLQKYLKTTDVRKRVFVSKRDCSAVVFTYVSRLADAVRAPRGACLPPCWGGAAGWRQRLRDPVLEECGVELSLKRDDLIHPAVSGNKWRKLK